MAGAMSTFKRLNMFKKLPEDLTISTAHGSLLTLVGAVAMVLLFVLELRAFLHVSVETMIEVDDTVDTMMRINFNVTVADAPCEYLSVDLTDITGTYEHNITRHISKVRLSQWRRWIAIHPEEGAGSPAYIKPSDAELAQIDAETRGGGAVARALADALADGRDPGDAVAAADGGKALDVHGNPMGEVVALSQATTAAYVQSHDMVFVNFFAPWCHWCQELEPIWKGAAARLPDLHYGERVKMASVDCVQHVEFCRTMHIRAFPTLVLYTEHTMDASLLYTSERSTQAFFDFLEANANAKHIEHEARAEAHIAAVAHRQRTSDHGPEGCMVAGHLLAKKVPGTFHIKLHSSGYSHDALLINSSHVVHHLSFGGSGGEGDAHADGAIMDLGKSTVRNAAFAVADNGQSFVHFHKVVCRMREYLAGTRVGSYSYTMHTSSHKETGKESFPSIKFSYDLSPMKVVEREKSMPLYHFVTSLCAIIGGFFTILSLLEGTVHFSVEALSKKLS